MQLAERPNLHTPGPRTLGNKHNVLRAEHCASNRKGMTLLGEKHHPHKSRYFQKNHCLRRTSIRNTIRSQSLVGTHQGPLTHDYAPCKPIHASKLEPGQKWSVQLRGREQAYCEALSWRHLVQLNCMWISTSFTVDRGPRFVNSRNIVLIAFIAIQKLDAIRVHWYLKVG